MTLLLLDVKHQPCLGVILPYYVCIISDSDSVPDGAKKEPWILMADYGFEEALWCVVFASESQTPLHVVHLATCSCAPWYLPELTVFLLS